jgi:hypothetical protein
VPSGIKVATPKNMPFILLFSLVIQEAKRGFRVHTVNAFPLAQTGFGSKLTVLRGHSENPAMADQIGDGFQNGPEALSLLLVPGDVRERGEVLHDSAALVPDRADEDRGPEHAAVLAAAAHLCI